MRIWIIRDEPNGHYDKNVISYECYHCAKKELKKHVDEQIQKHYLNKERYFLIELFDKDDENELMCYCVMDKESKFEIKVKETYRQPYDISIEREASHTFGLEEIEFVPKKKKSVPIKKSIK